MTDNQRYLGANLSYTELRDNKPAGREYFSNLAGKAPTVGSTIKALQKIENDIKILKQEIFNLETAYNKPNGPMRVARLEIDMKYTILNDIYLYGDLNPKRLNERFIRVLYDKATKIRFELGIQKKKSVNTSEQALLSFPVEQLIGADDVSMLNVLANNKTRISMKEFWKESRGYF